MIVQKFAHLPRRPPWTDLHQIWHSRWSRRPNIITHDNFLSIGFGAFIPWGVEFCHFPISRQLPLPWWWHYRQPVTISRQSTVRIFGRLVMYTNFNTWTWSASPTYSMEVRPLFNFFAILFGKTMTLFLLNKSDDLFSSSHWKTQHTFTKKYETNSTISIHT